MVFSFGMEEIITARIWISDPSKRASTAESPSTEAGATGTRARGRYEDLVHIARHAVHGTRKENWIENSIPSRRHVPPRRILHDPGKRLRPVVLHSQRHGERQELFKRRRRHDLQPLPVHAIHELLERKHRHASPRSFHRL